MVRIVGLTVLALIAFFVGRPLVVGAADMRVNYALQHDQAVTADPGAETVLLPSLPVEAQRVLSAKGPDGMRIVDKVMVLCAARWMIENNTLPLPGRVSTVYAPFGTTYVAWVHPCGPKTQVSVWRIDPRGQMWAANDSALDLNMIN